MQNRAVLLSVHPKFAEMIMSGQKKVEFRRVWAADAVSTIVIYATSPVKRILGVARVKKVHIGSCTRMWNIAKNHRGGITRDELFSYLNGRSSAFAIELEGVKRMSEASDPARLLGMDFVPPQSFCYLSKEQLKKLRI